MKKRKFITPLLLASLLAQSGFASLEAPASPAAVYSISFPSIGVRTLEYVDKTRKGRPVSVEIWYPADQNARDAAFADAKAPFPLVVMSHGHRGDRREKSWLAEELARAGYIVASVQHYGSDRAHYNPLLSLCFWERPRDISFALDALGKDTKVRRFIDWSRVGFVGYSLGGMTGLGLAGAVATRVKEKLLKEAEVIQAIGKDNLESFEFQEAEKDYTDSRIKAFLLLFPATHVYSSQSLQKVHVPIALVVSVGDEVLPHEMHGYRLIKNIVPQRLKVLHRDISHYVFLDRAKREVKKQTETQREIGAFAVDFFNEMLD